MNDNAFAVKNYFVKLQHFQSLQALTANPNYKVNHLWHRQQELNEELKAEADFQSWKYAPHLPELDFDESEFFNQ